MTQGGKPRAHRCEAVPTLRRRYTTHETQGDEARVSARLAAGAFSDTAWSSEERARYVAGWSRDVEEARSQIEAPR
jgi:hypothetical protein